MDQVCVHALICKQELAHAAICQGINQQSYPCSVTLVLQCPPSVLERNLNPTFLSASWIRSKIVLSHEQSAISIADSRCIRHPHASSYNCNGCSSHCICIWTSLTWTLSNCWSSHYSNSWSSHLYLNGIAIPDHRMASVSSTCLDLFHLLIVTLHLSIAMTDYSYCARLCGLCVYSAGFRRCVLVLVFFLTGSRGSTLRVFLYILQLLIICLHLRVLTRLNAFRRASVSVSRFIVSLKHCVVSLEPYVLVSPWVHTWLCLLVLLIILNGSEWNWKCHKRSVTILMKSNGYSSWKQKNGLKFGDFFLSIFNHPLKNFLARQWNPVSWTPVSGVSLSFPRSCSSRKWGKTSKRNWVMSKSIRNQEKKLSEQTITARMSKRKKIEPAGFSLPPPSSSLSWYLIILRIAVFKREFE